MLKYLDRKSRWWVNLQGSLRSISWSRVGTPFRKTTWFKRREVLINVAQLWFAKRSKIQIFRAFSCWLNYLKCRHTCALWKSLPIWKFSEIPQGFILKGLLVHLSFSQVSTKLIHSTWTWHLTTSIPPFAPLWVEVKNEVSHFFRFTKCLKK